MTVVPEGGGIPTNSITLGAESPDLESSRLIGCLEELVLNNHRIDLINALTITTATYVVTHGGVVSGCGYGEPCNNELCPHGSTCKSSWHDYLCTCDTERNYREVGGACVNPCHAHPCQNNGLCVVPPLTSSALFLCNCPTPFTGVTCEKNGQCEPGYYGSHCGRCKCDPRGVREGVCDETSGSCQCKVSA